MGYLGYTSVRLDCFNKQEYKAFDTKSREKQLLFGSLYTISVIGDDVGISFTSACFG